MFHFLYQYFLPLLQKLQTDYFLRHSFQRFHSFEYSNLKKTSLQGANLTDSDLSGTLLPDALDRTYLENAFFTYGTEMPFDGSTATKRGMLTQNQKLEQNKDDIDITIREPAHSNLRK